ncbi:MAG: nitrogenase cofactor biosynthesis protein NifB [Treponema sp.]|jgi:nitrogenase cofactor biosynthesis protein NifB|nr:nitrogenase cofactor biosynthesis protein NifB [Treponema sp.]
MPDTVKAVNLLKSIRHPCFSGCGGKLTRIHLPVAPGCNIQCNYCVRKFDCPNESRPGVSTAILSPEEALARYLLVKERIGKPDVVGIAGPGDALANFAAVRGTISLIRDSEPDATFCISTNGLLLPLYADELAALGVSHVTVTLNAVDPAIGRRIYRYVHFQGRRYTGLEGAKILLERQLEGIDRAQALGMVIKINIVMLMGLNDRHIPKIVEAAREKGADLSNIMQLIPVKGSLLEHLPLISNAEIMATRRKCEAILPQMYHCRQCRADAVGALDQDISRTLDEGFPSERASVAAAGCSAAESSGAGEGEALRFAVASNRGYVVDQHFGHAHSFYIYEYQDGRVSLLERRDIPQYCFGPAECRDHEALFGGIAGIIGDCAGVIVMRIGEAPREMLAERGIRVFMTYNYVTDAVKEAAAAIR